MAIMADVTRTSGELHDFHLASRKSEELALRRYQAVHWLECFVGPLGIPSEPSDTEFISFLRNGIIFCNVINKIQPGCIPKVVNNNEPVASESSIWDSKPLPAYQYFENVRNFLKAVKGLKLPAFEASDLENIEAGSAARIADCVLALKSYYEWKEWSGGNGVYKHVTVKSPLVLHSAAKNFCRPLSTISAQPCRRLHMSPVDEKQSLTDSIVKALTSYMIDSKENISDNFRASLRNGSQDPVQIFNEILSRCLEEKLQNKMPVLKSCSQNSSQEAGESHTPIALKENSTLIHNPEPLQGHRARTRKGSKDHWRMLQIQERDLFEIKTLWHNTKGEFQDLQSQLMNDLRHLGSLVEELSAPALRYQKVVRENRKLYNMAQDLKGNVRVYCRIRPLFNTEAKNVIDFIGQDGSLVIADPSKPSTDGRRFFQFNQVYGPAATQDELFKEIQPLIQSVMDGYKVCILAYGQTGSGKTHTMYGSSGFSEKEMGINFFALNALFQIAETRQDTNYEVLVQMVGICNEEIQDLLVEDSSFDGESRPPDITFHYAKSNADAIDLVKSGVTTSKINNLSNPFHSVVTIHVHGKDASGNICRGCLHLVDLAASGEDDKSLSCLEDVITSFSQKNSNIQQVNSKITTLLQDALGGNAKVVVFTHVIPEDGYFTQTISTLKFAQKVSTIELGAAQANKKNIEVMQLKQEIEILKNELGDKDPKSPLPNRQLRSPYDKTKAATERSPIKPRRLSIENPGIKQEKSPLKQLKTTENPSARKPVNPTTGRSREPKSPLGKPMLEGSFPRTRRLSIENPLISRSEKTQKLREPKSPNEGKTTLKKLENPNTTKPIADVRKSTKTPQSSLRARRLSLEGPKESAKKGLSSSVAVSSKDYISIMEFPKSPPLGAYTNGPTFTDCATKYPSSQPLKTPERQKLDLNEMQTTPGIAKSTNKESQIKRSLRTIGKLISGSEKRSQQVVESSSTKGKDIAREPRSPPTAKARALRRQSLTGIPPPPGLNRRSSLGGTSTETCTNDKRNAKTPPSVRSSTKINRWM